MAEHAYTYTPDGDKATDAQKLMNADNTTAYLTHTLGYSYDPRDRITQVAKDGATTESYTHDANSNVTAQTVNGATTTFGYDRNRLLTATTSSAVAGYNYDPFGRLDTVTSGGTVAQSSTYDGFDHIVSHQQRNATGGMDTTSYTYDPLDRKTSQTAAGKTTSYAYLGLSNDLISESSGGSVTKSYTYTPPGLRLSQTTHNTDGTTTPGYYTYNDHSDVEAVTGAAGNTTATYGYTAYGQDDKTQFTGADKTAPQPGSQPFNPYRFNAMRWDSATTQYDMGFRTYDPGLNQFLTRDMYDGAADDMSLDTDPFTGNRYTFGAGNPITNIELDGHVNTAATAGGCDSSLPGCPGYRAPASSPASGPPSSPGSRPQGCIGPRNPLPVPCSALHQGNALPWLWKQIEDLTGITATKACLDNPSLGRCTMAALQLLTDALIVAKGAKIVAALLRPVLRALGLLGKAAEAADGVTATASVSKFSDYIFKAGATHGKDAVFTSYGYSGADSQTLAAEYEQQAAAQYAAGNYQLGRLDQYGQRITIPIKLTGQGAAAGRSTWINTGWMIRFGRIDYPKHSVQRIREMTTQFMLYQRVRVVTDRFTAERAPRGTVGYIIERYQDGAYEVEVSNPDTGETVAQFVADTSDLEAAPEA